MHLLEEVVGPVDDGSRQADPVGHQSDLTERVREGSVRAAHLRAAGSQEVTARSRGGHMSRRGRGGVTGHGGVAQGSQGGHNGVAEGSGKSHTGVTVGIGAAGW